MNLIKNISLLFCLSFLFAGNITELYKVDGMHCQYGCANKVQTMVSKLDGIKKISDSRIRSGNIDIQDAICGNGPKESQKISDVNIVTNKP